MRVLYQDDSGQWQPTKRGVTLYPDLWDEFKQAAVQVDAHLDRPTGRHRSKGMASKGLRVTEGMKRDNSMIDLTIDPELQSLIPPLTAEEQGQLEANLLAEGCRESLVIWAGESPAAAHPCQVPWALQLPLGMMLEQVTWICPTYDTAGEVLHPLVRCIGIVVISDRDSEVYHASPDADRTYPP